MSLSQIMSQDLGYNESGKSQFHKEAKKVLRKIAKNLGLVKGEFEIRSNQSGIAGSGDVKLHTDTLYVSIGQSSMGERGQVLFRSCQGLKDFSGGVNNFMSARQLEMDKGLSELKRVGAL